MKIYFFSKTLNGVLPLGNTPFNFKTLKLFDMA